VAWLPDPQRSRAVLIGVSSYEKLPVIAAAATDVTGLATQLTDPELWGLPHAHCVQVHDPRTTADVLEPVHQAALDAQDALVVFFAGHGLLDEGGRLYLALPGGDQERLHHAVAFDEIRREIVTTGRRCRAKIAILDCCFSGRAMPGFMSGPVRFADRTAVEGAYLLTATAETVPALAPPGARHTAFTGALIETLRDGVPGGPVLLDMDTVFEHLTRQLDARHQPLPQRRSRNAGHLVALARNRASDRATVPAPASAPHSVPFSVPHGTRRLWWPAAALLVAVALVAAAIRWLPDGSAPSSSPPGPTPAASTAAGSTAAASTATPSARPTTERITIEPRKPASVLDDRVVVTMTDGPIWIWLTMVTPQGTCHVEKLEVGERVVIPQTGGAWVSVAAVDIFPPVSPAPAFPPVTFEVAWHPTGPAPKSSRRCD
jgi:hypothetical protein